MEVGWREVEERRRGRKGRREGKKAIGLSSGQVARAASANHAVFDIILHARVRVIYRYR